MSEEGVVMIGRQTWLKVRDVEEKLLIKYEKK